MHFKNKLVSIVLRNKSPKLWILTEFFWLRNLGFGLQTFDFETRWIDFCAICSIEKGNIIWNMFWSFRFRKMHFQRQTYSTFLPVKVRLGGYLRKS